MKKAIFSALLGGCCLWGGLATQAADGPSQADLFDRLDANKDGILTAAEAGKDNLSLFGRLVRLSDTNKDGKLSRAEFLGEAAGTTPPAEQPKPPAEQPKPERPAGEKPRAEEQPKLNFEELFKLADRNGDGMVTLNEVRPEDREKLEKVLPFFDRNGDKALSFDEYRGLISQLATQEEKAKEANQNNGNQGQLGPIGTQILQHLSTADRNGDGKISREEMPNQIRVSS